jgi:hypothetical protein
MHISPLRWCWCVFVAVLIAGCQEKRADNGAAPTPPAPADAAEEEIKAYLAQLGSEDQSLAEKQKYCAVMPQIRLGEMGAPYKVTIKGETAFVCCKKCFRDAKNDPEKALEQLKELKDRAAAAGSK